MFPRLLFCNSFLPFSKQGRACQYLVGKATTEYGVYPALTLCNGQHGTCSCASTEQRHRRVLASIRNTHSTNSAVETATLRSTGSGSHLQTKVPGKHTRHSSTCQRIPLTTDADKPLNKLFTACDRQRHCHRQGGGKSSSAFLVWRYYLTAHEELCHRALLLSRRKDISRCQ